MKQGHGGSLINFFARVNGKLSAIGKFGKKDLPAGKIIAVCRLEKCLRVIESN
jgi:hypothetical protein